MRTSPCLLLLLVVPALAGAGDIYRHTDASGRPVFTDAPPENAERVELPPTNTVPGTARRKAPSDERTQETTKPTVYSSLVLGGAPQGEVIQNPDGGITITATPDVPLAPGHQVVYYRDGKEAGRGTYSIERLDRGTYNITAAIVDETGRVLVSSPPLTFYVQRPRVR